MKGRPGWVGEENVVLFLLYKKKKWLQFLAHKSKFHIILLSTDELNGRTNFSSVGYVQE